MFFIKKLLFKVNVVPVSDLQGKAAAKAFMGVNPYKGITLKGNGYDMYLETDDDPSKMIFPKGWYTAKGHLRNKHMSSGIYTEIPLFNNLGNMWYSCSSVHGADQVAGKDFSVSTLMDVIIAMNPNSEMTDLRTVTIRKRPKDLNVVEGWQITMGGNIFRPRITLSSGTNVLTIIIR